MLIRDGKGFTLVELVVVVAILAILAGVAVPVYSGYIEKAHEAADLQLLDSMNTAFAAACAARGIDPRAIATDGVMIAPKPGSGNTITGITVIGGDGKYAGLDEDFLTFFGDNANTSFQNYDVENITLQDGVFTAQENALAQRWELSSFNQHEEKLLGSLDQLSSAIDGSEGLSELLSALSTDDPEVEGLRQALRDYPDYLNRYQASERGNATVLYIADHSAGRNTDEALQSALRTIDLLKSVTLQNSADINELRDLLVEMSQNSTAIEEVGLAYALVTGYYNNKGTDLPSLENGLSSALRLIQNTAKLSDFDKYLQGKGRADISAYLSAMQVLKDNASQVNLDREDAFASLLNMLKDLLGKT